MHYWILKSEPDTFSIDNLARLKNRTAHWDGVRNYQARNFLRDQMKVGDLAFFYHSSCSEPAIVGIVEIVRAAYPDFTAFDAHDPHYDPKSSAENPRWYMVDVQLERKFDKPVTLQQLKTHKTLAGMRLLARGNRLSVMPVAKREWEYILDLERR